MKIYSVFILLLFLFPITIKSMLTEEFVKGELSEPENSRKERKKRSRSLLTALDDSSDTSDSGDSDIKKSKFNDYLAKLEVSPEVDVHNFLEMYFGNVPSKEDPYYGAVWDVLDGYCKDNKEQFIKISKFLAPFEDDKDTEKMALRTSFHNDFLKNNEHAEMQELFTEIIGKAFSQLNDRKKLALKESGRRYKLTTTACIVSLVTWTSVILAALIPASILC